MIQKTFNFYCDESTHLENDGFPYMLLAYVSSAYNQVRLHSQKIKDLKSQHRYKGEIKWSKISESNYLFCADVIDYFFTTDLYFRAVVVDKSQIDDSAFGKSYDDFYYKMFYQLLHHKISMEHNYNIYIDIKDTCSHVKLRRLNDILNVKYGNIRNLQFIHSYESNLMQITDLLMGALNYNLRGVGKLPAKIKLIEKIKRHAHHPLTHTTALNADKFNLFFIDLK